MELLTMVVGKVNGFLWGAPGMILLCGTGIWYSFKTGFIQIRGFKEGWNMTFGGLFSKSEKPDDSGISSFQALATAIAAQVGTGNLAGAATAIAVGGPGAIFWMWISAFFGMATIYAEATMAQKYKHTDAVTGKVTGGPVYYIRAAMHDSPLAKVIAGAFAVFIIMALGFMGNAVQSNSIADAFSTAFGVKGIITGVILAVVGFFIFVGGIKRIAVITERMVPFMAVFYIVGSLIVIGANFRNIPLAFYEIVVGAFNPQAIAGGVIGATMKIAMSKGIARGLFSNEAGMGSTPHAHAMAKVAHPSQQGFVAMIGVFIDTFVILNLTAFVIITSRSITPDGSLTGTALTQVAFSSVFGSFGNIFIAICMLFFAFSTIIGWYFFGETNIRYLFGEKAIKPYALLVCVCIILGSLAKVSLIWDMSDCFNGLMVIPNLCGLLLLTNQVVDIKNDYFNNFKKNKAEKAAAKK